VCLSMYRNATPVTPSVMVALGRRQGTALDALRIGRKVTAWSYVLVITTRTS